MPKKIFISHSTVDEKIGEQLVDSLIELGVPKDIIFYSSKYHTGVGLGNNFPQTIKSALQESELVIFLLTKNFYQSAFCLNEMGATWYSGKKLIPILLGGLKFEDMKGFINSQYIVMKPNVDDIEKLSSSMKNYIDIVNNRQSTEDIFKGFLQEANRIAEINKQYANIENEEISNIEKYILQNRFTDNEILLLNYFITIQDNLIADEDDDKKKNTSG